MQDSKNQGFMVLGGGALMVLGSFLPWASVLGISVNGMDTDDGIITLVLGILLAGLGYMLALRPPQRWVSIAAVSLGAISVVVGLIDLFDVLGTEGVSVGFGLWLVVIGAVVASVGAFLRLRTPA